MHGQRLQKSGHKFSQPPAGNNNRATAAFSNDIANIHNISHVLDNLDNCMCKKIDSALDFCIPVPSPYLLCLLVCPFYILFFIIFFKFTFFDFPPPPFVFLIPLHCHSDTLFPVNFRLPSQRTKFI